MTRNNNHRILINRITNKRKTLRRSVFTRSRNFLRNSFTFSQVNFRRPFYQIKRNAMSETEPAKLSRITGAHLKINDEKPLKPGPSAYNHFCLINEDGLLLAQGTHSKGYNDINNIKVPNDILSVTDLYGIGQNSKVNGKGTFQRLFNQFNILAKVATRNMSEEIQQKLCKRAVTDFTCLATLKRDYPAVYQSTQNLICHWMKQTKLTPIGRYNNINRLIRIVSEHYYPEAYEDVEMAPEIAEKK